MYALATPTHPTPLQPQTLGAQRSRATSRLAVSSSISPSDAPANAMSCACQGSILHWKLPTESVGEPAFTQETPEKYGSLECLPPRKPRKKGVLSSVQVRTFPLRLSSGFQISGTAPRRCTPAPPKSEPRTKRLGNETAQARRSREKPRPTFDALPCLRWLKRESKWKPPILRVLETIPRWARLT